MSERNYRRFFVFWAFVLVSAYLVYVYPVFRILHWYGWGGAVGWYLPLALWAVVSTGLWLSFNGRAAALKTVLVNWMGVGFIFFSLCLVYEIVRLLVQVDDDKAAVWIVAAGTMLSLFAVFVALRLAHRHIRITSPKLGRNYRIVQISDVHIGSRSAKFLHDVVRSINKLAPDYVMITGDLLDTGKVGLEHLSALERLASSAYFITGNHERYVGLDHVLPILEQVGVGVLRNSAVLEHDIQFIGIDDADDPEQVAKILPLIDMHPTKFRVLLYHRPLGWHAAVGEGIELMLSGHTHNGQIYPFNWLVKRQFKLIKGIHRDGGSHLYVSPGTGTWGPVMRLGSRNEITCFDLIAETPESG